MTYDVRPLLLVVGGNAACSSACAMCNDLKSTTILSVFVVVINLVYKVVYVNNIFLLFT